MNPDKPARWERLAGAGGLAFVALVIAGTFVAPYPGDVAPAKFAAVLREGAFRLRIGAALVTLGSAAFLAFLTSLHSRLVGARPEPSPWPTMVAASGVAMVLLGLLPWPVTAAALAMAERGQAESARALSEVAGQLGGFSQPGGVLFGALLAGVVLSGTQALPRWLRRWTAALSVTVVLVSSVGLTLGLQPAVLVLLGVPWVVATSVVLRRPAEGRPSQAPGRINA